MTAHRVAVVMITHNRRDEALSTLDRMARHSDAAPTIVVDNASADGTADAVARRHPEVTVMALRENRGAAARNLAVERAGTPYVAFCDDDTVWEDGSLAAAADVLDRYPSIGAVMGRGLVEPELAEDPITPELRHSPVPAPDWLPGPALLGVLAGFTMVRRRAFLDVGGFCPRIWLGGEEELLSWDLAARGWWLCWAENVTVRHRPSAGRDSRHRRQLGIRNTLWTLWLRRPWRRALLRSADLVASAPRDRATLTAVGEALRGLPWALRRRRVVPDGLERNLRLLEADRAHRTARSYTD
ncbi:Glycosyltransferase, GT2 family [Prauserella aidingensis]|uniref:glycosyltransferase family 2 protein n=1 Tax=Prauserella aidingensis TaxID=387890 RepID=UPI0020A59D87|nr:glycosyltransferase [Prauserella aidingensis]MCP2254137.1 Glycosyltransferase, GT2 family [Prauserella aidingensis]